MCNITFTQKSYFCGSGEIVRGIDNCYLRSCHLWIRSDKFVDGSFNLRELFS